MTQDEIMEMWNSVIKYAPSEVRITEFANLVAAKEREEANAKANASWELMCKKMVVFEREACAKLVDYWEAREGEHADAIRARGEQA